VAVAVSSSNAKVVSIGDGAYAFLKETDMSLYRHHLDFLKEAEIPVILDRASLEERGLTEKDLVEVVTVKEHGEILGIIAEADATLTF
jgi:sulfur relay (sulfurtransferase) DsrF/TusC family protein